jgi:hypothetical protein
MLPRTRALMDANTALGRSLAALAAIRSGLRGTLPLATAEALMDDVEDHLNIVGVRLNRASELLQAELDHAEAM